MSKQPTPETDANEAWPASKLKLGNDSFVPAEFARSLERERDEARKEVEYYRERYEQLKEGGNERTPEIPRWYNGREIPADIKEETK